MKKYGTIVVGVFDTDKMLFKILTIQGVHTVDIKISERNNLKYLIKFPDGYKIGERYPVILLLHGAGGRGNDINVLMENPYFKITEKYKKFPFITVAPLCSANTWFDLFEQIEGLVYEIAEMEYTDKERLYLMGASMGGYATWQLAMSLPEMFAAIVPICGGGMYWNASRLVNVPVWAFHGKLDDVVLVRESEKMVEAVNENGGMARLTIYPNNGHNAWSDTYGNYEVFEWLLSNVNFNAKKLEDIYNDADIYG